MTVRELEDFFVVLDSSGPDGVGKVVLQESEEVLTIGQQACFWDRHFNFRNHCVRNGRQRLNTGAGRWGRNVEDREGYFAGQLIIARSLRRSLQLKAQLREANGDAAGPVGPKGDAVRVMTGDWGEGVSNRSGFAIVDHDIGNLCQCIYLLNCLRRDIADIM